MESNLRTMPCKAVIVAVNHEIITDILPIAQHSGSEKDATGMGTTLQSQPVARGYKGTMIARRSVPDNGGQVDGVAPSPPTIGAALEIHADGVGGCGLKVTVVTCKEAEHVAVGTLHQRGVAIATAHPLPFHKGLRLGPAAPLVGAVAEDDVDILRQVLITVFPLVVDRQQGAVVETEQRRDAPELRAIIAHSVEAQAVAERLFRFRDRPVAACRFNSFRFRRPFWTFGTPRGAERHHSQRHQHHKLFHILRLPLVYSSRFCLNHSTNLGRSSKGWKPLLKGSSGTGTVSM